MPTETRDINAQALILGGQIIPLGGDTESVDVQQGEANRVTRSASGRTVAQRVRAPDDQLVVNFYPEDPGHKAISRAIMAKKAAVKLAPGTRLGLGPGSFTDAARGVSYTWSDSILLTPARGQGGQETATVSWTFALVDLVEVQL